MALSGARPLSFVRAVSYLILSHPAVEDFVVELNTSLKPLNEKGEVFFDIWGSVGRTEIDRPTDV